MNDKRNKAFDMAIIGLALVALVGMAYFYANNPEVFHKKLMCHCMIGCDQKLNVSIRGEELCECVTGCNYEMSNTTTETRINITSYLS